MTTSVNQILTFSEARLRDDFSARGFRDRHRAVITKIACSIFAALGFVFAASSVGLMVIGAATSPFTWAALVVIASGSLALAGGFIYYAVTYKNFEDPAICAAIRARIATQKNVSLTKLTEKYGLENLELIYKTPEERKELFKLIKGWLFHMELVSFMDRPDLWTLDSFLPQEFHNIIGEFSKVANRYRDALQELSRAAEAVDPAKFLEYVKAYKQAGIGDHLDLTTSSENEGRMRALLTQGYNEECTPLKEKYKALLKAQ